MALPNLNLNLNLKLNLNLLVLAITLMVSNVVLAGESTTNVGSISVETMPPVVVKTFPQAGDTNVDPDIGEIRVTFSKDMMTEEMWSWVKVSNDTFPELTGNVRYLSDKRTCVAPVKLERGKTYAIWFNSNQFNAFRDKNNNPAIPYLLVFETRE
jgi:RNA polymerase sigma-70 factor (ECF subfamily)